MPLYDVRCLICGKEQEVFLKLSEYENTPECCEQMTVRVIRPTQIMPDIQPYKSTVTGEYIGSRSTHKKHLKTHRLIELGNEVPKAPPAKREYSNKERLELRKQIYQIMDQKS